MTRRFLLSSLLLGAAAARADVKPHALFSEGAVLQRDTEVPVWGFSDKEGEKVTVTLDGVAPVETVAHDGKWRVTLPAQKVGAPRTLTIKGDNAVVVKDLLFGEVWICSGQSNMEMNFGRYNYGNKITGGDEAVKHSLDPKIRFFDVPNATSAKPVENVAASWKQVSPQTVPGFSAVGYFFARDLRKALGDVPVGMIESDWGGTPAQSWTSREALEALPAWKAKLANPPKAVKYPQNEPVMLRNAMITPLIPYAFRGVIWYQGESNGNNAAAAKDYRTLFPAMIADWRKAWGRGDFPFLFVQIAPFNGQTPEIREAQMLTLAKSPVTAMVQTLDIGEPKNIHPKAKQPVGERLALAARAVAYGEKVEWSGPLFDSVKFAGGAAVVSFSHAGSGLALKGDAKGLFVIAGADGKFVPAEAKIEDGKLVVSAKEVTAPTAVRYAWSNAPHAVLFSGNGLPASPFRSDVE